LDAAVQAQEAQALEIFAAIAFLFRRRAPEEGPGPSVQEHFYAYLRHLDGHGASLPTGIHLHLVSLLRHYGLHGLDRTDRLEEALYRLFQSHVRADSQLPLVQGILQRWASQGLKMQDPAGVAALRVSMERLLEGTQGQFQTIAYLVRELSFQLFEGARLELARHARHGRLERMLASMEQATDAAARARTRQQLLSAPDPLVRLLSPDTLRGPDLLELLVQSYHRTSTVHIEWWDEIPVAITTGSGGQVAAVAAEWSRLGELQQALRSRPAPTSLELYLYCAAAPGTVAEVANVLVRFVQGLAWPGLKRLAAVATGRFRTIDVHHLTFLHEDGELREQVTFRGVHPAAVERMGLATRLEAFTREWVPCDEDVYLCRAEARSNARDVRLVAVAELFTATPARDSEEHVSIPELDWILRHVLTAIRKVRARRGTDRKDWLNWILLYVWPDMGLTPHQIRHLARRLAPVAGLQAVICLRCQPWDVLVMNSEETGPSVEVTPASDQPLEALDDYALKVVRLRQRGAISPYEVVRLLTHAGQDMVQAGDFAEHDLVEGRLEPVSRPPGRNVANLVVGVVRNFTTRYPEGMRRVIVLGDPSRAMGAVAEPECSRIIAALDLAHELQAPLDWFAVSAGARIAMDSGVENMDWISRVLARIVRFTQAGGEINLVVDGINVGAQPYWNAEATMLMHTRGILIMTPRGAMVLTGKKALDYSGTVSADDNSEIGGYDRIMGPNGQAQYWAGNLHDACVLLLKHHDYTYLAPGERTPRRAVTSDPVDRDVRHHPYAEDGSGFHCIGDVFSEELNPGRKKPFDIRQIMQAVIDADRPPLERWADMAKSVTAVVWNAHLGGYPVCLIGFESRPLPRTGFIPVDGPNQWTSGTLFPQSSRKVARAINSASGVVPVVVLANLTGFDGSPESMRRWQLEHGAEIGRAVVNFHGPMVFCVVSRFHGGSYVVFSHVLNENLHIAALEGSFASVIGGAPAAAVVFAGEVEKRTRSDPRLVQLEAEIAAPGADKTALRAAWLELSLTVQAEKLGQVAEEFDAVHTVERALAVGALHCIIPAARLRPHLVEALEKGLRLALAEAR
jgi:acetyl-CoA carboxylase carboxyltransferase component